MRIFRYLFIVVFLNLFVDQGISQIRVKVYYDLNWKISREKAATFYREAIYDTLRRYFVGEVKDFTKDGQLFMEGHYDLGEKNGQFSFYYTGTKALQSEGMYTRNYRTGKWKFYYPNGQLEQVVNFDFGDFSVIDYYNEKGNKKVKNGNGQWELEINVGLEDPVVLSGEFKDGKKSGIWYYRYRKGGNIAAEEFDEGRFIVGAKYHGDSIGNYHQSLFKANVFEPVYFDIVESFQYDKQVDQSDYPFFKFLPKNSELSRFYTYLQYHIRYPEEARKNKIEGKVIVSFEVYADGSVKNIKILKGLEGGCNEEVIRVIKQLPAGIFQVTDEKEVKTLPITFRLG